jgi:hypothetical protein
MSSSGSKPNIKEIVIEHGEKFILGLAGVFVLIGIGTTQWSTYEKKPEEFSAKIDAGKAEFARSTWPETEKVTFEARDPGDEVVRLLDGIPSSQRYEYLVKKVHRITKAREKVAEPEYLGIENLVADAGRVLIELSPEQEEAAGGSEYRIGSAEEVAAAGKVGQPKVDRPRVEGPRVEGPRTTGARPGGNGLEGAESYDETSNYGEELEDEYGMDNEYGGMPGYGGTKRNVEARGTRFAAIRGIFQMKQQVEKVKRALRLDTAQEAYMQVRFWDFELQRQTAVAGADPWANEWEDVDIDVAVKLLERIEFDVDVVDEQYRDAVFTMPLPYRVTGSWSTAAGPNGILASHPQIKRLLNAKEQQEQENRAKALLKAAEREEKIKESTGRGFQRVQVNTRSMRGSMMGNSAAMSAYTESYNELQLEADQEYGDEASRFSGNRAMGRMDVFATPELMLFRFLDFSVVPGNAYRYRVRLKLLNPNFDRDPGELQDFASREGKYRFTPWSEVSTPALIQDENEVYVAKVDPRRGVSIDAYQWMSETGSYVHGPFEGLDRGDRIASWTREEKSRRRGGETEIKGGVTTEVLRPSAGTFMEEQIDFVTPNTLVDYNRETLLDPNEHPDLELATKKIPNSFQEVVVVNRFGDLVRLDTVGSAPAHESAKSRMTQQDELWAHLKRAAATPGGVGDISELMMEGGEDEYGGGGGYPGMGGGKPYNPKRRSSLKRNSMMMMGEGGGTDEEEGYP